MKYNKEFQRESKKKILNETEIDGLVEWISFEPTVTLELNKMRMYTEFGQNVSTNTLGTYLDCRHVAMK